MILKKLCLVIIVLVAVGVNAEIVFADQVQDSNVIFEATVCPLENYWIKQQTYKVTKHVLSIVDVSGPGGLLDRQPNTLGHSYEVIRIRQIQFGMTIEVTYKMYDLMGEQIEEAVLFNKLTKSIQVSGSEILSALNCIRNKWLD